MRRQELIFSATFKGSGSYLTVLHLLKVVAEVIEETIGFDKMRDKRADLSLVFDLLLVDGGLPNLPSKPLLSSLLQASSLSVMPSALITSIMSKAAGSMADKHSLTLASGLTSMKTNDSLWRWQESESVD